MPDQTVPARLTTDPAHPLLTSSSSLDDDPLKVRVSWLMVFRSVVITVLLVTAIAVRASAEEALFARAAVLLYAVAAAAYLSILLGAVALRWWRASPVIVTYSQLFADAVVATVLVWVTGGAESIFAFLYSLTVLNAAIVMGRRASLILAGASTGLFAAVAITAVEDWHRAVPTVLTNAASFFLVAVLAGYLTAQLTHTSARLEVARAQIVKLEELYAAVLASLPSGVMSVDALGNVVYANNAGAEILGRRPQTMVGASLQRVAAALDPVVQRGDPTRFEVDVELQDRGRRVLGGSVAPLRGFDDAGSVVVFQDLTELRRLQDDIARAERLAELGRMAAGLAHEVRNPLAAMTGCLQLLDVGAMGAEDQKLVGIVQRETERLNGLVHDFLTYARPAPPQPRRLPVRALVEGTVGAVAHGLRHSEVTFGDVVDVEIEVDESQLQQVIWNIVTNADRVLEAVDDPHVQSGEVHGEQQADRVQGRGRGRIRVSAFVEGDNVIICVDDNGPGVPVEIRAQIFEPFFTTRADGNGLGLATCQQLVRQNRGSIGVDVAPDLRGARFAIRLPRVA